MENLIELFYKILFWGKCLGGVWVVYAITYNWVTWKHPKTNKTVGRWDQASIERTDISHPNSQVAKVKTKKHIGQDYWLADSVNETEKKGSPWAIQIIYGIQKIIFYPSFIKRDE